MREVDVERARIAAAIELLNRHVKQYLYSKHHRTRSVQADHTRWQAFEGVMHRLQLVMEAMDESDEEAFGRLARKILQDEGANDSMAAMLTDIVYGELGQLEQEAANANGA